MMANIGGRSCAYVLVALALIPIQTASVDASDWSTTIKQLERQGASKQQLAIAYNNYALTLSNNKQWDEAEKNLRRALRMDPRNGDIKENLATTLMNHAAVLSRARTHNDRHANTKALGLANEALKHKPKWVEAYVLIGDIEYADQRLERARLAWDKASQLRPSSTPIKDRLKRLDREAVVEQSFDKGGSAYFDLRYENDIRSSTAHDLNSVLMQARRDIGREFHFWPDRRIVVLVYSSDNFAKVRRGPDWVAGVYDGKIRIRYPDSESAFESIKPTLVHEYTHALIHDLAQGNCPAWLNEGLAEYQEAKVRAPNLDFLRTAVRLDKLIALSQLNAALRSDDGLTASLAYQQSFSLVIYMAREYKFFRVTQVLEHLAAGRSLERALQQAFSISLAQLEKDWKQWLTDQVR